jgi:hypothetical protein
MRRTVLITGASSGIGKAGLDRDHALIVFPFLFGLMTRIGGLLPDRIRRWTMVPFRFTVSDR